MAKSDMPIYTGPQSLAPYPLSLSSPQINPVDRGKIRTIAVESMYKAAEVQMDLLRKQANLLLQQAQEIENRIAISERIYMADMNFEPVLGCIYHIYQKGNKEIISMIAPMEWGHGGCKFDIWLASVRLLGDRTWEILAENTL